MAIRRQDGDDTMLWLMGALTVLGGVLNTVQSGTNATLAKSLEQPIFAALIVALVNGLFYLAVGAFVGIGLPRGTVFASVPWWAWFGGAFGGLYVLATIFFAEKLGAGIFIGLTVTAGVLTSIVMDHYGLVGFKPHPLNWPRVGGAILMLGGLALVAAN